MISCPVCRRTAVRLVAYVAAIVVVMHTVLTRDVAASWLWVLCPWVFVCNGLALRLMDEDERVLGHG